jgi:acyl transferase domain-containing protein
MRNADYSNTIAIIGMAGRFPGARNVDEYWKNLRGGVESITFFTDEELLSAQIPIESIENSKYVKARGVVEKAEYFDAEFFGITDHAAENMDPQQRILLETVWHALENSGYLSEKDAGVVSVYASAGQWDSYLWESLNKNGRSDNPVENFQRFSGNSLDFLATHISYAFNFTGPSYSIQSACSTGLLSVCLACESLLLMKSDMAVSGTVNVMYPRAGGYFQTDGMIFSPDGHCRPFDIDSHGTLESEGVGALILKRTEDAIRDGDQILAIIKGFGVNNDGNEKVGYTAPSVSGQANVIIEAMTIADIDAHTVAYVETHGTGTKLGDPIEIKALTNAYRTLGATKNNYCAIGSVKANIGHLDVAAGTASLIKAILILTKKEIPPSINFREPNPEIEFSSTPFFVADKLLPWEEREYPRRAGVSSFGIGGTNTHVILEEAPKVYHKQKTSNRSAHILVVSAKSEKALDELLLDYQKFLAVSKDALSDICYTSSICRMHFDHRVAVIARDREELIEKLNNKKYIQTAITKDKQFRVNFKQSSQKGLQINSIHDNAVTIDIGSDVDERSLLDMLGNYYIQGAEIDWQDFYSSCSYHKISTPLYPFQRKRYWPMNSQLRISQKTIHPLLGEMHTHPDGRITCYGKLNLATLSYVRDHIIFGQCIFPGTGYIEIMLAAGVHVLESEKIQLAHMSFEAALSLDLGKILEFQLSLTPVDNGYDVAIYSQGDSSAWRCHARSTVSLRQGESNASPFDIGAISARCKKSINREEFYQYINTTGMTLGAVFQALQTLRLGEREAIGELKLAVSAEGYYAHPALLDGCLMDGCAPISITGMKIDSAKPKTLYIPLGCDSVEFYAPFGDHIFAYWEETELTDTTRAGNIKVYSPSGRLLASLEGFHFRKTTEASLKQVLSHESNINEFLYEWTWQDYPIGTVDSPDKLGQWLVIGNNSVSNGLRKIFENHGGSFTTIETNNIPASKQEFETLLKSISINGVIHLASADTSTSPDEGDVAASQSIGAKSYLHLCQALTQLQSNLNIPLILITNDEVSNSTLSGLFKTAVLEYPASKLKYIQLCGECEPKLLFDALTQDNNENMISVKNNRYLVPRLQRLKQEKSLAKTKINADSCYLITGGVGGLGFKLTEWLLKNGAGQIVLTGRHELDATVKSALSLLHDPKSVVTYETADMSNQKSVKQLLARLEKSDKPLKGIFHLAGTIDDAILIEQDWEHFEKVYAAKVYGSYYLHQYSKNLDIFVMYSSIAATLGSPGQSNYAAANSFMNSLSEYRHAQGLPALSIGWGPWGTVGMAKSLSSRLARNGLISLSPTEGLRALEAMLITDKANVAIAHINWKLYINQLSRLPAWLSNFSQDRKEQETLLTQIQSANQADKEYAVKAFVTNIMRTVLGKSAMEDIDEKQGFFDLGLDSLMAVDVRNRIQDGLGGAVRVRPSVVFDYANIHNMTRHLCDELGIKYESGSKKPPDDAGSKDNEIDRNIGKMTEEEAMQLLREELGDEHK